MKRCLSAALHGHARLGRPLIKRSARWGRGCRMQIPNPLALSPAMAGIGTYASTSNVRFCRAARGPEWHEAATPARYRRYRW